MDQFNLSRNNGIPVFLGVLSTPQFFPDYLSPIVAELSLTKTFNSPIGEILDEKIGAVSATAKKTPRHLEAFNGE